MAAYREFRRAVEIRNTQRAWKNEEYRQALERAIELDPTFTRAIAALQRPSPDLSCANSYHAGHAIPESLANFDGIL
jgi:hypothetical protein